MRSSPVWIRNSLTSSGGLHHAVRLANTDGNPGTEADPDWTALILAPRFPEYVSNHASITGAFMHTLARLLGDEQSFTLSLTKLSCLCLDL